MMSFTVSSRGGSVGVRRKIMEFCGSIVCALWHSYRCANFAGGVLPNHAALVADWVANLAMSSRRRNFCFLNLLNLALSPFCDDTCPYSSNLFVTQRAEDRSFRSSIRQATDGRCGAQGTLRRTHCSACGRLLGFNCSFSGKSAVVSCNSYAHCCSISRCNSR
jgi:hypothetical protein